MNGKERENMKESYSEYLVKRKTPISAYMVNAMMVVLTLVSLFLALTSNGFAILLFCAVSFCTYLIFRNSHVEFEYLFIDNQLTVDQIMGRAKRRKICDIDMGDIRIIAPSGSEAVKACRSGQERILDFSSHMPNRKTYTAIIAKGGSRREVIFEPDDRMLECMYMSAPQKVMK